MINNFYKRLKKRLKKDFFLSFKFKKNTPYILISINLNIRCNHDYRKFNNNKVAGTLSYKGNYSLRKQFLNVALGF